LERLDQRLQRPLIQISAPAGYGKISLINRWQEANGPSTGRVSVDKSNNDLRLTGFIMR
jgi:ATP/maltotriose-dependent transcriptional regulator MalT